MIKRLKIGYFADGKWGHNAFDKLVNDNEIEIGFVCVRFDSDDETLYRLAKTYNIDYLKHKNINSKEFIQSVKKYNCDLFVSMSFNQIFKSEILNLSKFKTINCHAGKLPKYRGRNILNWVLINDEKEFGITVHYMDEGIDTGDIILQKTFCIKDDSTYETLLEVAYKECANILYEAICMFKKGAPKGIKQSGIGFYCSQRKVGDEILDWNQNSRDIFNFVRAICSPGPMARAFIAGKEMKINKVIELKKAVDYRCIVGAILHIDKDGFLVKTKDSFVKIVEFEFDGKIKIGDRFDIK